MSEPISSIEKERDELWNEVEAARSKLRARFPGECAPDESLADLVKRASDELVRLQLVLANAVVEIERLRAARDYIHRAWNQIAKEKEALCAYIANQPAPHLHLGNIHLLPMPMDGKPAVNGAPEQPDTWQDHTCKWTRDKSHPGRKYDTDCGEKVIMRSDLIPLICFCGRKPIEVGE